MMFYRLNADCYNISKTDTIYNLFSLFKKYSHTVQYNQLLKYNEKVLYEIYNGDQLNIEHKFMYWSTYPYSCIIVNL